MLVGAAVGFTVEPSTVGDLVGAAVGAEGANVGPGVALVGATVGGAVGSSMAEHVWVTLAEANSHVAHAPSLVGPHPTR